MPRTVKYTEAKGAQIVQRLRAGCTRKDATESVGVHNMTLYNWLARFPDFAAAVMEAEASVMVEMTALVVKAARTDPKYALEVLRRRRPDEWGDRLNLSNKSDDDLLNEARSILDRAGAGGAGGTDAPGADG